jgi:hypothetical protein
MEPLGEAAPPAALARIPSPAAVGAVAAAAPVSPGHAALAGALSAAFPPLRFTVADCDITWYLSEKRLLAADLGLVAEAFGPWLESELAHRGNDADAVWCAWKESGLVFAETEGRSLFAFAPLGDGAADYVQIEIGLEQERIGGTPFRYRPYRVEALREDAHGPSPRDGEPVGEPRYVPRRSKATVPYMRTFLERCARAERQRREARRPEMEAKVIRTQHIDTGLRRRSKAQGVIEPPLESVTEERFLDRYPDWFDRKPAIVRFFEDWAESGAPQRVYELFAIETYEGAQGWNPYPGEPDAIGGIPRPLTLPSQRLRVEGRSAFEVMAAAEKLDEEAGMPFAWFFLGVHGNYVDGDVIRLIAEAVHRKRIGVSAGQAAILRRWMAESYGF